MKIVLFRGRPGAGKTAAAKALSERLHLPVLCKDDIYDKLAEWITTYEARSKATHEILYAILTTNSSADCTFILDFPYQRESDLQKLSDFCAQYSVNFKPVLVTCSDELLWAARIKQRSENPAPNQIITDFEEFKRYYGTMHIEPRPGELLIDSSRPLQDNIEAVIRYI